MKAKFTVYGMTCSACVSAVERGVKKLDGVQKAGVNLSSGALIVEYDEKLLAQEQIIAAVVKAGYKAEIYAGGELKSDYGIRFFASLPFMLALFYLCMGGMLGLPVPEFLSAHTHPLINACVQAGLFLPVGVLNYKYFTVGFKRLFKLSPNMDSLIATGALACVIYSVCVTVKIGVLQSAGELAAACEKVHSLYFESAAMIFTLVTLGKLLEEKSKRKTGDALKKLKELLPSEANVLRGEKIVTVPLSQIKIGDLLAVREGEGVCLDGVVYKGEGSVNQAAITGESIPVYKSVGDDVVSGGVLESGNLIIKVTASGENSTLSRIIAMVEEAGASKAPVSELADKIAAVFVPAVICVALIVFAVWQIVTGNFQTAFTRGVSVLVVSCPCALGLATPLAVMLGTGKSAERGVLIRSGGALQTLATVTAVAFDKTGTLTEGKPVVSAAEFFEDKQEALSVAYALESQSSHPLAKAICDYCVQNGAATAVFGSVENLRGKGVRGVVGGEEYYAVSYAYACDNGLIGGLFDKCAALFNAYAQSGATPVFLIKGNVPLAVFAVKDEIKKGAASACEALKNSGYKVTMITGDNPKTASAVASELGIDFIAGVLPDGKRDAVCSLKNSGYKVAFVGDGINDAPALAEADVGVAVSAGTEIAICNAGVILMKNDPTDVAFALSLGKKSLRVIKQNLFWAFFYNCLCIPLAAGALSFAGISFTPGFSAAMMSLSSLFVVSNSLRLSLFGCKRAEVKALAGGSCQNGGACAVKTPLAERSGVIEALGGAKTPSVVETPSSAQENYKNENSVNNTNKAASGNKMEVVMKKYVYVNGMMCGHCKARVEKILGGLNGVKSAVVELENKRAVIEVADGFDEAAVKQAVNDADYEFVKCENA